MRPLQGRARREAKGTRACARMVGRLISAAQNDEPELERFHYPKQKQDDLIEYFKLTPKEWEDWNRSVTARRTFGGLRSKS